MARARVHQHVNPLAKYFRELPIEPLDAEEVFEDPSLPADGTRAGDPQVNEELQL